MINQLKRFMIPLAGICICQTSPAETYDHSEKGMAFMAEMQGQFGYDESELARLFGQVSRDDRILEKISRPAEKTLPWHEYRSIFLDQARINNGVSFYQQHQAVLTQAYEKYGVAPAIIVAIIGVETRYGKFMGKDRVLTALTTIGFDYPKRASYFKQELRAFLQMVAEEQFDPMNVYGSYAGAMGMAQFMPSSYLAYAVDYDGDGKRDLWTNPNDAIFSVANYLAQHGWQPDGVIAETASGDYSGPSVDKPFKPFTPLAVLKANGLQPDHADAFTDDTVVGYLSLAGKNGTLSWITFNNFAVITTYNTSPMYAMAVTELSTAITSRL